jgi:hypothetical protein
MNLKPFSEVRSDNRILISLASVVYAPAQLLGTSASLLGSPDRSPADGIRGQG